MKLIPETILEDDWVGIPVYGTNDHFWFTCSENETLIDAWSRVNDLSKKCETIVCYQSFSIWNEEEKDEEDSSISLFFYECECLKTKKDYLLVSKNELPYCDFEDIKHSFCIPNNKINILIVVKELLLPFADKNFGY